MKNLTKSNSTPKCSVKDCFSKLSKDRHGRPRLKRGLCSKHYARLLKHGNTETTLSSRHTKHGLYYHPYYSVHRSMISRCEKPNHPAYKWYGARGITVCDEWKDPVAYIRYIELELGPKPTKHHSIDRIDDSKGYEPGNIRWATKKEQANNRIYSRNTATGEGNIYKLKATGHFYVRFWDATKRINLGTYRTLHEAIEIRDRYLGGGESA